MLARLTVMRIEPTLSSHPIPDRRSRQDQDRRASSERRYGGPERRRARHVARTSTWLSSPFAAQLIGQYCVETSGSASRMAEASGAYARTSRL